MAVEIPVAVPGIFTAAADLSAKQFHAVKLDGDLALNISGAGEYSYGILQNKPDTNNCEACVMRLGVSKGKLGGTVVAGDKLAADALGALVVAGSGDHVVAIALDGGAAGEICTVDVLPVSTPLA